MKRLLHLPLRAPMLDFVGYLDSTAAPAKVRNQAVVARILGQLESGAQSCALGWPDKAVAHEKGKGQVRKATVAAAIAIEGLAVLTDEAEFAAATIAADADIIEAAEKASLPNAWAGLGLLHHHHLRLLLHRHSHRLCHRLCHDDLTRLCHDNLARLDHLGYHLRHRKGLSTRHCMSEPDV